jgi:hypothetical protein
MASSIVIDESRHNFYHIIHKALRLGHCRILAALGSHDYRDAARTAVLMAELRGLLVLGKGHLDGEDREIHAPLEQRVPGASAHATDDHEEHAHSFEEIETLIRAVETSTDATREAAGHALYKRYALFAAHDFEHMNAEETELLATLHGAFTDEELHGMEGRIVGAIPPPKMAAYLKLMIPAMNHRERVEFIGRMKSAMPEPVFSGVLSEAIKPSLTPEEFAACVRELKA